jgi:hypothetical protein
MSKDERWKGRLIDEMNREELAVSLKEAVALLRSVRPDAFLPPEIEVEQTPSGTVIGRTFNWAFIPAGHLWSDEDRSDVQARLDAFAARHGFPGAVVHFSPDRLEVRIRSQLQIEQILSLQEWLEAEKDALDVSQVP